MLTKCIIFIIIYIIITIISFITFLSLIAFILLLFHTVNLAGSTVATFTLNMFAFVLPNPLVSSTTM